MRSAIAILNEKGNDIMKKAMIFVIICSCCLAREGGLVVVFGYIFSSYEDC